MKLTHVSCSECRGTTYSLRQDRSADRYRRWWFLVCQSCGHIVLTLMEDKRAMYNQRLCRFTKRTDRRRVK